MLSAPAWLRESFRDGVDEFAAAEGKLPERDYARGRCQEEACFLAPFDGHRRPCSGPFERFHFSNRQRVENAMYALLLGTIVDYGAEVRGGFAPGVKNQIIMYAAWDPRNGGIACEGHHRPFDNHATPGLSVPAADLPPRVPEFLRETGLVTTSANIFGIPLDARPALT